MSTEFLADGCHLVGSVPAETGESVFTAVSQHLGQHLRRMPDGEIGRRSVWIAWQAELLARHPDLEPDLSYPPFVIADPSVNRSDAVNLYMKRIRDGRLDGMPDGAGALVRRYFLKARGSKDPASIDVEPEYAKEGLASYERFVELRDRGVIPKHLRFQVCLPSATAICSSFISPRHSLAFHRAYERALIREVGRLAAGIPARDLAIQFDVCIEFMQLEGVYPEYFPDTFVGNCASLGRLAGAVPEGVEVGFHLCYGDAGGKHIVEPTDGANLTRMANGIAAAVPRNIDWVHFPVPIARTDDAYFAPFAGLRLAPSTELYVGLIHDSDGGRTNGARIAAARKVLPRFGVATECGFGRRPQPTVLSLLDMHAQLSRPTAPP